MKKALFEFYRSLEFLRNYKVNCCSKNTPGFSLEIELTLISQALNATGFAKILKKFDKVSIELDNTKPMFWSLNLHDLSRQRDGRLPIFTTRSFKNMTGIVQRTLIH